MLYIIVLIMYVQNRVYIVILIREIIFNMMNLLV
nr:MAG TPA: hypothetical protein [Bacteriophage sp.]